MNIGPYEPSENDIYEEALREMHLRSFEILEFIDEDEVRPPSELSSITSIDGIEKIEGFSSSQELDRYAYTDSDSDNELANVPHFSARPDDIYSNDVIPSAPLLDLLINSSESGVFHPSGESLSTVKNAVQHEKNVDRAIVMRGMLEYCILYSPETNHFYKLDQAEVPGQRFCGEYIEFMYAEQPDDIRHVVVVLNRKPSPPFPFRNEKYTDAEIQVRFVYDETRSYSTEIEGLRLHLDENVEYGGLTFSSNMFLEGGEEYLGWIQLDLLPDLHFTVTSITKAISETHQKHLDEAVDMKKYILKLEKEQNEKSKKDAEKTATTSEKETKSETQPEPRSVATGVTTHTLLLHPPFDEPKMDRIVNKPSATMAIIPFNSRQKVPALKPFLGASKEPKGQQTNALKPDPGLALLPLPKKTDISVLEKKQKMKKPSTESVFKVMDIGFGPKTNPNKKDRVASTFHQLFNLGNNDSKSLVPVRNPRKYSYKEFSNPFLTRDGRSSRSSTIVHAWGDDSDDEMPSYGWSQRNEEHFDEGQPKTAWYQLDCGMGRSDGAWGADDRHEDTGYPSREYEWNRGPVVDNDYCDYSTRCREESPEEAYRRRESEDDWRSDRSWNNRNYRHNSEDELRYRDLCEARYRSPSNSPTTANRPRDHDWMDEGRALSTLSADVDTSPWIHSELWRDKSFSGFGERNGSQDNAADEMSYSFQRVAPKNNNDHGTQDQKKKEQMNSQCGCYGDRSGRSIPLPSPEEYERQAKYQESFKYLRYNIIPSLRRMQFATATERKFLEDVMMEIEDKLVEI